jgi:hypothetical protein
MKTREPKVIGEDPTLPSPAISEPDKLLRFTDEEWARACNALAEDALDESVNSSAWATRTEQRRMCYGMPPFPAVTITRLRAEMSLRLAMAVVSCPSMNQFDAALKVMRGA